MNRFRFYLLALLFVLSATRASQAAAYTWNLGTNGSWDTTTANWTGAGSTWVNGATSDALFNGTAVTVTANQAITAHAMTFDISAYTVRTTNGSVLTLAGAGAGIVTNFSAASSVSFSLAFGGSDGFTKSGTGRVVLNTACTYTGATTISSGVLQIASGNDRLPITTDLSIASGSTLIIGTGRTQQVAALTGAGTVSGAGASPVTFTVGGSDATFAGAILNGGTGGVNVVKVGTGAQTFGGSSTSNYSLGTAINAGTLIAAKSSAFGTGAVTVASGATWSLQGGITQSNAGTFAGPGAAGHPGAIENLSGSNTLSGALALSGPAAIVVGAGNLTVSGGVNTATNALTLGVQTGSTLTVQTTGISGSGPVTKSGAGTLVLAAANSYTGATTLSAGTLLVNGSLDAASATTVASGATLGGTGTVGGSVTLSTGGRLSPGSGGIGTLTLGSATWNGSVTALACDLGAAGASDKVVVTGVLTKGTGSGFTFDFQGGGASGTTYTLMTFASTTFNALDFAATNLAGSRLGTFAIVGGTTLTFTIPDVPVITGGTSATGTIGRALSFAVTATNSPTSYALATGALPTGVTLDTSTGQISGTPTQFGTFNFSVTATNGGGTSTGVSGSIVIDTNVANGAELAAALTARAESVVFAADVDTSGDLPPIEPETTTIEGNGHTLSGGGLYRGLVVQSGATLAVNDLTITNCRASGANGTGGGGGGAGLGGAMFIKSGAAVTVSNVTLSANNASGGSGTTGTGGNGGHSSLGTGGDTGSGASFGGGGRAAVIPGAGGFGGGGGGNLTAGVPAAGGFGGGAGAFAGGVSGSGGGGLGAGGALFVQQGGTLTIAGSITVGGNTVTAGTGANAGSALGSGIFVQGDGTLTFSPADGETQTINDAIADQTGSGGTGGISLTGAGTLILAGTNTYTGATGVVTGRLLVNGSLSAGSAVNIGTAATLGGTGTASGTVALSGLLSTNDGQLTLGSLDWAATGQLAETIGGTATPPIITGALTKNGSGSYIIALTDGGVIPGTTYTLMTFGSVTGFSASDFTVTGITGTLTLEANALKFTVPVVPVYGVRVSVAKGKNRATFTITNTGNTATRYRVLPGIEITKGGKKPSYKVRYLLGGIDITSAVGKGTALTDSIPPRSTAQVTVEIKVLKKSSGKRTAVALVLAISQADSSARAKAQAKFVLKAGKK